MPALSLPSTLLLFSLQALVFSGAGVAAQIWRRRLTGQGSTALEAVLLAALAPCALGFIAFVAYFIHPYVGMVFSWAAIALVLCTLVDTYVLREVETRNPTTVSATRPAVHGRLILLTLGAGVFYISALFVYTKPTFAETAAQRFLPDLPGEHEIPRRLAEGLYQGQSPKKIGGDWLSSDRPPLQTGLALVTMPALRGLNFGFDKACATAGVWFQLLWIPALWVFLRWLGLTEHQAHAATAALVFTGFLMFNSVYVWPKLAGAALVLLAFCTFFATEQAIDARHRWVAGGSLAALGSLAHGGVLFSLLALIPLGLSSLRGRGRQWLMAAAAFTVVSLPWFAYQRWYEPPGNRLVKEQLAGVGAPEERGVVETMVAGYRAQGWHKTIEVRRENLRTLFLGEWRHLLTTSDREAIGGRRREEAFHTFRTASTWILGAAALPWLIWQYFRRRPAWLGHVRRHGLAIAWLGLTLALWLGCMFQPQGTLIHEGSYVIPLLLVGITTVWAMLAHRRIFAGLAVVQLGLFTLTWMPPGRAFATAVPTPGAIGAAGVAALLVAMLGVDAYLRARRNAPTGPASDATLLTRARDWLRAPRLTPWVFAAFAILLFLRKPYALIVPQLYAEDGTIFLVRNDLMGGPVFLEPYMGYLHTLPRLIAWTAAETLDPAWWPTFYNGISFAIWLAVIVRTFSPRLPVPAALRPWLALTFFFGPQSGEVLSCVTNLQWVIAFLIVEQAFIAPPATTRERIGDIALILLLGLTGPFIIALGPLLAWRWWRARTGNNFAILLAATVCAAIQGWYIVRTGPKFEFPPFVASKFFEVVGQHLVVWSVFGDELARKLPPAAVGVVGIGLTVALLAWAARPHPRRLLRAQLIVAFVLMMAAGVYRSRPDTWSLDNLVFGDRYFYLPRLLLAWLLVLEFDTTQRTIAWIARALAIACALVHLKGYSIPPETDHRWTEHVDPIRRGVRGDMMTLPGEWLLEYQGRRPR